MPGAGIGALLSSYSQARRGKVQDERDKEDRERDVKLKTYQYSIDHADELGLTEDDLRTIFNDVGTSFGHKPDPKILGIFNAGGGDKGKPDLGDMLFPASKRDKTSIQGSREGQSISPDSFGQGQNEQEAKTIEGELGPPPEMMTQRRGEVPVRELHEREQLNQKQAIAQAQSKGQLQWAYDKEGNLKAYTYDPIQQTLKPVPIEEGTSAVSTVNKRVGAEATANKDLNTEVGLLRADPQYQGMSDGDVQAIASHNVQTKRKAELSKTQARTDELKASTNLKRARTSQILDPKITPYQAASLGLRQQAIEMSAARAAITEGRFDQSISKDLTRDLSQFYTSRNNALKLIEEGNEAKGKNDLVTAASKWRLGYSLLGQSKMQAETLQSMYGDMVNIANTDPGNDGEFPWVEVNFDVPSKQVEKQGGGRGKRQFTPSKQVAPEMIEKYREWLKSKPGVTPEIIEQKVKQYAATGQQ